MSPKVSTFLWMCRQRQFRRTSGTILVLFIFNEIRDTNLSFACHSGGEGYLFVPSIYMLHFCRKKITAKVMYNQTLK